jgi:competence protein ComEA
MGSSGERSKGQVLAYVAAAVLVAVAGFRYLGGAEDEPASAPVEIEDPASEAGTTGGGGDATRLHVHVAGAVREDGLYTMPSGARVGAAIDRAGGPTAGAELAGVNLAAEL